MKTNLSRQITLLGIGAMAFYAALFATGEVSVEILPQFAVSAAFFLFSGKVLRQMANRMPKRPKKDQAEVDWAYRTIILNWVAASIIISAMILVLAKPADVTYLDLLQMTSGKVDYPIMTLP